MDENELQAARLLIETVRGDYGTFSDEGTEICHAAEVLEAYLDSTPIVCQCDN